MSTETTTPPKPDAPIATPEPVAKMLRGESRYDRICSMLLSMVLSLGFIVGFLALIHLTNQAYATRATAPLEIIEVVGGEAGGGDPGGDPMDLGEAMDAGGAAPGDAASNSDDENIVDFQEPSVQQVNATALDMASPNEAMDMEVGAATKSNNQLANGPRRSKLGTGRVGLGVGGGGGDGGVRREQRWRIVYNPGQTPEEYARQLDAIGVEIGVIRNNAMTGVSRLSAASPQVRGLQHASDGRLFFVWQSNTRKAADVDLLRKAGVEVGESPIFHYYPKAAEEELAQLEFKFKGRQPIEIKSTSFAVVPKGGTLGFQVLSQEPLVR